MAYGSCLYEIKLEIYNCKQKGQNVAAYYAHLKKLWDELATTNEFSYMIVKTHDR